MDLPSNPPVSPAVRITVLLRPASEGVQDAFGARPEWLGAPPGEPGRLRGGGGAERTGQLRKATGRRAGDGYAARRPRRGGWLEAPPVDLAELREAVGAERIGQLRKATGLREGDGYAAGGPPGVVRLAAAAHEGVLGLLGVAAMPPDVLVEQTDQGPRYHVPE